MKLVTFHRDGALLPGCLFGDDVLDFSGAVDQLGLSVQPPASVAGIMDESTGALASARTILAAVEAADAATRAQLVSAGALSPISSARFAAPLPNPRTVFSHGQAYHSHLLDFDPNAPREKPKNPPAGFLKCLSSIIGPGEAIRVPPRAPDMLDYEGEICVVFGRECYGVSAAEAMDYVAGYTIINDVSARDWTPFLNDPAVHNKVGYSALNIMYKNFPTFCPMGPVVVTKDEIADHRQMRLVTRLNGAVMQDAVVSDLIWDIPELIESYSGTLRFMPGDIMSTGTPGGVGAGRKPPVFMKPGDVIEVEVTGVGVLANPIVGAGKG